MWEKFTTSSKKAIKRATEEAKHFRNDYVDTEHLLLGLISDDNAFAVRVLKEIDVPIDRLRSHVVQEIPIGAYDFENVQFSTSTKRVLEHAYKEARNLKHQHIGTEHLLLGLMKVTSGKAYRMLKDFGATYQPARNKTLEIINSTQRPQKHKTKTPTLDEFGIDLTREAKEHRLDPIVGRKRETQRIIQILSKRTKNNPVLIGEPGVGKTAIVEGLAQMIVDKKIPKTLRNCRVIALDLAGLVAGTKFRGEFEDRLKRVMKEITQATDEKIILFIDELHTIIGAGAAEGAIDASNILKPALSRGKLRCIGATTPNEFKKHIERHGALERRFQPINVDEPTVEETIDILMGLKDRYEEFHNVKFTDEAIYQSVYLSHRFITSRCLPDKAIDLMDEAAAKVRVGLGVHSIEEALINVVEEEKNAETEISENSDDSVEDLEDDTLDTSELDDPSSIETEDVEKLITPFTDTAAEPKLVTVDEIADVVHSWTGIPVSSIAEDETEKLLRMEEYLGRRIVGQEEAVTAVSRALRRARVGLKDPNRPMGCFLFTGPTGVGKTELAKTLAEFLFGDELSLVRYDMSEYMEKHSVSRLVGAPPGYVGYDEGGQLTEAVKRRPYSVILLDEIEKAHFDVFNILLQVMEDGILTDNQGRRVDMKNTILIMTSNLGTEAVGVDEPMGFRMGQEEEFNADKIYRQFQPKVQEALKKTFRPEFINRLDESILFRPLTYSEITKILDRFMVRVSVSLKSHDLKLEISDEAKRFLVDHGFSKHQGARPLRRVVQRKIEDPLSELILKGEFKAGDTIYIDLKDEGLVFEHEKEMAETSSTTT